MPKPFASLPHPLLFAHRGASAEAPENTLAAFEIAARHGAHVLELDVHLSRDGEVVVMHDASLERTTDGRGRVRDHTWEELARLDAGYQFRGASGGFPFRGKGHRIPRLLEVFERFGHLGLNVELKQREPSMIEPVRAVLERAAPPHLLLTAGDDAVMGQLEAGRLGYPLGMSTAQARRVLRCAWLGGHIPWRGRALQIPPRWGRLPVATNRLFVYAKAHDLAVHLWTINDPREAQRWIQRGVDGIMTDDPGAMAPIFGL